MVNQKRLLRSRARRKDRTTYTRPEGAGNFDNMDDKNIVDQINIKVGTVDVEPRVDKEIANKKYVDSKFPVTHASTTGKTTDDHHAEIHTIASHDTTATGAELDTLTDNSVANTLHRHSELVASDGSPDPVVSVNDTGKVGINRTVPKEKLHIYDSNAKMRIEIATGDTDTWTNDQPGLQLGCTGTQNNDYGAAINFVTFDGALTTTNPKTMAYIVVQAAEGFNADTDGGGHLVFGTSPVNPGTGSGAVDRMKIDSNGNVGIGTTNPGAKLTLDDGTLLFQNGGGLCYGEIYAVGNSTETTITTMGTPVQVTVFDTNGESNNTTPDQTQDHITILKAGRYLINCSVVVESVSGGGSVCHLHIGRNNNATEFGNIHSHRNLSGGGGDKGSISMSGIVNCAANDTIELWVRNDTGTENYVVADVSFCLQQVGG